MSDILSVSVQDFLHGRKSELREQIRMKYCPEEWIVIMSNGGLTGVCSV